MQLPSVEIDRALAQIEPQLQALARAIGQPDPAALDAASDALQRTLLTVAARLRTARLASAAEMPATLRDRVRACESGLGALREALSRASAARERAHQLLMPAESHAYGAHGSGLRAGSTGSVTA